MGSALLQEICLPFLLGAQNSDHGWGFHAGSVSRVEPTVWALTALRECSALPQQQDSATRALQYLAAAQSTDGSWPSSPEIADGSWVTSLACWALLGRDGYLTNVTRGLDWLTQDVPGEARFLRRIMHRFMKNNKLASQNDAYFGWSWTPGTASWVEPTAYAIILILNSPPELLPPKITRRLRLAETMLYDRMCPGGGWNCGNPMVYGVAGEPQTVPTAWALLALRHRRERPEVHKSLQWLVENSRAIRSPGSLALALIALRAYQFPHPGLAESLHALYDDKEILWNVPDVAWGALALSSTAKWLDRNPVGTAA